MEGGLQEATEAAGETGDWSREPPRTSLSQEESTCSCTSTQTHLWRLHDDVGGGLSDVCRLHLLPLLFRCFSCSQETRLRRIYFKKKITQHNNSATSTGCKRWFCPDLWVLLSDVVAFRDQMSPETWKTNVEEPACTSGEGKCPSPGQGDVNVGAAGEQTWAEGLKHRLPRPWLESAPPLRRSFQISLPDKRPAVLI